MAAPLISVIVPVYNVEAYLDRCVRSIVEQTYENLEILLVDDGSPDNCPAMCDAWARKDPRIKVIHQKNGGLSAARNAGMAAATGEYLAFADSDDYLHPEMYRLLLETMQSEGSDISACGVEMVFEDGSPSRPLTARGRHCLNRTQAMEAVLREDLLKQPVWYKLYRRSLVGDIPFPVGKYHEDVFWTYRAVARASRVSVFDTPCYFYVQRGGSIMAERYSLRRLDAIEAKCLRRDFLKAEFPVLSGLAAKDLAFSCLYHGQLAQRDLTGEDRQKALTYLRETLRTSLETVPDDLSLTHKCWLRLAGMNFSLTCRLRNLLGVGL